MSLLLATQITAVATAVLALFAIVTAAFAYLAFYSQSQELSDQASLLKIQSDQLEEQRKVNEKQIDVLTLQAQELEASLTERKDQAESERQAQANRVAAWFAWYPIENPFGGTQHDWGAVIRNDSELPILSVRVFFHYIHAFSTASEEWEPILRGGPPDRIRVIAPHSEKFVAIPDQIKNMVNECNDNIYAVSIEFVDAAGNRWERNARGALVAM
jgi:hypothetical protein